MPEDKRKVLVQVFPREQEDGCGSKPACKLECRGCGKGPTGSEALTLDRLIRLLREEHAERVELRLADYSSEEAKAESAETLNALLEAGGNELRVSTDNLSEVLKQAAPVIAVDGKIASIIAVPTRSALDRMLGATGQQQSPA